MCAHVRPRAIELLAPAGGPAEFNAALAAGADAIYCGYGQTFNARRGAESFDATTFAEACRRAHLAGSVVFVTVNVVVRDEELPSVLALVRRAWLLGADAFIIQDWGLLSEVRRLWPEVACHLSTQTNVHDARAVAWAGRLGVERVTLSRELTLEEHAKIAATGVETEAFGHGALCFCYSGICQMSSAAGTRSANRGACAQPCRLPMELVDEAGRPVSAAGRGRPLCPRDLCTLDDLAELAAAGVSSVKVEGRLKGPDYVFAVVSAYRGAIDDVAAGRAPDAAEDERRHRLVRRAFNRDFTDAYLWGASGDEMMSYERSNNRGELVGTVVGGRSLGTVKVRRGGSDGGRGRLRTARVAEVDVYLDLPIGAGDLLELRPVSDPAQFITTIARSDAAAGETVTLEVARTVEKGSLVRVIRSEAALAAGKAAAALAVPRHRQVQVEVTARLGEPLSVLVRTADGVAQARAEGPVVEAARTRAVSEADLASHACRLGGTPFAQVGCEVTLDEGVGLAFSALHAVRAEAVKRLEDAILAPWAARSLSEAPSRQALRQAQADGRPAREQGPLEVCALVATPEAARAALAAGATCVYARVDTLGKGSWPEGVVPVLDEVCREADHARNDPFVRPEAPVAVGNVSALVLAHERGARAEVRPCIPVHNASCARLLEREGATSVWLSGELSLREISELAQATTLPLGLVVLGRARAMTTEHCVLQVADACVHDCARCALRMRPHFLKGDDGERWPVTTDLAGRSRIYASRVTDACPQVGELARIGVTRLMADCTLLDEDECARAVGRVVEAVRRHERGERPLTRLAGATSGHLFAEIG